MSNPDYTIDPPESTRYACGLTFGEMRDAMQYRKVRDFSCLAAGFMLGFGACGVWLAWLIG